jgi:anti-sigma factor RsiW
MIEKMDHWALSAYCDGELDPQDRAAVEKYLTENHDARRVVDSINTQKQALKSAYDSVLEETVPQSLTDAINAKRTASSGWTKWAQVASVALLLGATAGWFGATWNINDRMSQNVADAFQNRALDAHIVFASDFSHAVEVSGANPVQLQNWLERRVGAKFGIPDLTSKGYGLIGGRLLAEGDKPAGLLMYEDAKTKQRLSIYFAKNDRLDNTPMRIQYRDKLMTCFWTEPDLVYALAGEQPKDEMLPLAELAHDGFEVGEG